LAVVVANDKPLIPLHKTTFEDIAFKKPEPAMEMQP
jgi:hypothetical protein